MSSERSNEKGSRFLYKQFGGIIFIWKTLPFRFFLIYMSVIFLLMITFYTIVSPIAHITGENAFIEFCILIGFYVFFGLFMFIVIELFLFYLVIKNYKLFPEKSQHHYLRYYPPIKAWTIKIHSLLIMGCLVISFLLILLDIFVLNIRTFYFLDIFDEIVPAVLIGFMAFLSLKNTMESFENRNSAKFRRKTIYYAIFLLIPWILLILTLILWPSFIMLGSEYWEFQVLIGGSILAVFPFLCLFGIIALFKRSWRVGYTLSIVSMLISYLLIIYLPFFVDLFWEFIGIIVAFSVLLFSFIQGNLNEAGKQLEEYHLAWDEKLSEFNITSEKDFHNMNYDPSFHTKPLQTRVPVTYRNVIFYLIILTATIYSLISYIGTTFALFGLEVGIEATEFDYNLIFVAKIIAFAIGAIIYVILITLRQAKSISKE